MNSAMTKTLAGAAVALAMAATASGASAGSFGKLGKAHHATSVDVVTYRADAADTHVYRRHHHHTRDGVLVEAPFTTVDTRYHRSVAVDAPFTSVRVHGGGVWVRAPFVNLWVPR